MKTNKTECKCHCHEPGFYHGSFCSKCSCKEKHLNGQICECFQKEQPKCKYCWDKGFYSVWKGIHGSADFPGDPNYGKNPYWNNIPCSRCNYQKEQPEQKESQQSALITPPQKLNTGQLLEDCIKSISYHLRTENREAVVHIPPQNWEEQFDQLWNKNSPMKVTTLPDGQREFKQDKPFNVTEATFEEIKAFISTQRKQACREMIEYIEKQVPEYNPEIDNAPEYMDAIAWAEEFLKKMP